MQTIQYRDLEIQIEKKKIRHMYLRLYPGETAVRISAPEQIPLQEIYAFVDRKYFWIQEKQNLLLPDSSSVREYTRADRQRLWERVEKYRSMCEEIAGVQASEWRLRKMKTRWGTCNIQKKRIWLSMMLCDRDDECLVYVMLHELTHFYEPDHGREFWNRMDHFCPDWREIRKRLKSR